MLSTQGECGIHVESEMVRGERSKVSRREVKKPRGGGQTAAVGRVIRVLALLAQMHESSRQLDESLVETRIGSGLLQPKVLQHIVRLVVISGVEAREIPRVARRPPEPADAEFADKCLDAVAFLHPGKLALRGPPAKLPRNLRLVSAAEKDSIGA